MYEKAVDKGEGIITSAQKKEDDRMIIFRDEETITKEELLEGDAYESENESI